MKHIKRFLSAVLAALMIITPPAAYPAFDPVNDDTDIYLANPNITAERPNILIALDNTANWQNPFTNEKSALRSVVLALDDSYNVGLMMMPETGNPNDSVDGGYVRFHVRQMTLENKTALASIVNNFDILADKGNNATHGAMLYEAYLYYAGLAAVAGFGKVKADHDGTTLAPVKDLPLTVGAPARPNRALPGPDPDQPRPLTNGVYRSPIADGCAKNYVILISNGKADENVTEIGTMESRIVALTGSNAIINVPAAPQKKGDWADEMAKFMANTDVNTSLANTQNVITYVVEVDAGSQNLDLQWSAVLESTAINGKGKYFKVSSDASGSAIVDALTQIFSEVQAVNSVFASTTLPVSVNVRGTNLNQVYIGVFRPDPNKAPRWLGNLKMYNLALNTSTNTVFLADASNDPPPHASPPPTGVPAENASTGFVAGSAISFWTDNSTFWGFRDASQNGSGGASDSADGDLVEKGGAAQQIRVTYPNADTPQAGQATRNIYTCTDGGLFTSQCAASAGSGNPGSQLLATPFATNNTDITSSLLNLTTRLVSPLTGFQSKAVTSLTDRRNVSLSNAPAGAKDITLLDNGTLLSTRTITNLTTAVPKVVTALSAADTVTQTITLNSFSRSGSTCTVGYSTTPLPSGFFVGASATFTINPTSNTTHGTTKTMDSLDTTNQRFTVTCSGNDNFTSGTASTNAAVQTTTARATVASHGYTDGQSVTIAGASPSQFTTGPNPDGSFFIVRVDNDTFTYTMSLAGGAATPNPTITAAGNTTTATATYSGPTTLVGVPSVTISGANPSGYNSGVGGTASPTPISNQTFDAGTGTGTFTYTVGSALSANIASPVYATSGGSTTVNATALAHGFLDGQAVNISGADIAGYNGTFNITFVDLDTFRYTTASVLPKNNTYPVKASAGTQATVTATLNNHGFSAVAPNNEVVIESASTPADPNHPGTHTITTVVDANTFTYTTLVGGVPTALPAPTGTFTARPPTASTRAYATITGHGYGVAGGTKQVLIENATPAAYNGTFTATVVDADTIYYPLTTAPGPNTSASVTSKVMTSTATATSVAHGFSTNDSVTISGAVDPVTGAPLAAFNGTKTVTVLNANTFTYPLGSDQGDAGGTILASGTASTDRANLIRWVRGEDNFADENTSGSTTDIRASVHGDVLHSRPAVINYARFLKADGVTKTDDDVFIFYGANDGLFHAIKGGYAVPAGDTSGLQPGQEAWGFIPQEFFGQFTRMRNNSPKIGSAFKRPYFMDGPIAVYTNDANGDGKIVAADGDRVILYIGLRRGGRFIYAIDVSDPLDPKFMWKISNATAGFSELGETWSQTTVVQEGLSGYPKPVLVMGGGYDSTVEDLDPARITALTATTVTTTAGTFTRTMGRAMYVIDALTGQLIWRAVRTADASATPAGAGTTYVADLDYAIPSDISVIKNFSGGAINRAYVGDTGGQLWRMDFKSDTPGDSSVQNLNGTTVSKIGSIADTTVVAGAGVPGLRKFQHAPDVVAETGFDAILLGSGDREHPFDTSVTNRFYMFKDKGNDLGPVTGATEPTITEAAIAGPPAFAGMSDLTSNCIQDALGCVGGETQSGVSDKLGTDRGWFITLLSGEKVVGNAISVAGITFFNTNQPDAGAGGGTCGSNLGIARQYQVSTADATAVSDLNAGGGLTGADRFPPPTFGGFLPSPVHVVVMLEGKPVEAVISGIQVSTPAGATLASRLRKYWYKEVDL